MLYDGAKQLEKKLPQFERYLKKRFSRLSGPKKAIAGVVVTLIILLLGFGLTHFSTQLEGNINEAVYHQCSLIKLVDGDSINARCPDSNGGIVDLKVRVYGIDAPEMRQKPWGEESRQYLKHLFVYGVNHPPFNKKSDASDQALKRQNFTLEVKDTDRYQRKVAKIIHNGVDLGLEMVRGGQAVVYEQYNKDPKYPPAEMEAKRARRGIWRENGPHQDPAQWRRTN